MRYINLRLQKMHATLRKTILALGLGVMATGSHAEGLLQDISLRARLGYNLGGTAPVGLPASIRGLNKYTLQPTPIIGLDVTRPLTGRLGVTVGLHVENKGMKIDARVKGYHQEFVRGSEKLAGYFTGDVTTKAAMWMVTIPVQATYELTPNLQLRLGPYFSVLTDRNFTGYAHSGYLRVDDPTGAKIELGDDYATRGDFDFSDDLRHLQWGLGAGVDWTVYRRLGVFAELNWGLSGIHHSGFKTIEQRLYPIFGTFGVTYRIR